MELVWNQHAWYWTAQLRFYRSSLPIARYLCT